MKAVGRSGGRAVSRTMALAALLTAGPPDRLTAQRVAIGPQVVVADYREVTGNLHYQGIGYGGAASLVLGKFSGDVAVARLDYEPADGSTAVLKFQAIQFDARVRYYVASYVSLEAGVTSREAEPEFEAQSLGAVRVGARMSYPLGPAARIAMRGNYLAAAKFSGGGSAPFGIELGLGVSGDLFRTRLRLSADYEFQRLDRKTDDGSGAVGVPIQQSLVRLGAAVAF